ncbi:hypothetical protein M758_12G158200, partial [Ceratodon purpureus]
MADGDDGCAASRNKERQRQGHATHNSREILGQEVSKCEDGAPRDEMRWSGCKTIEPSTATKIMGLLLSKAAPHLPKSSGAVAVAMMLLLLKWEWFCSVQSAFHTDGYGRVRHGGEGMHSLHMTQSAFQALKWDQWLRRTDVQCV